MDTKTQLTEVPLYIKVNGVDNVAIVVNTGGLDQGTVFPCGLELKERVPQGHKVALMDIVENEAIIRYGKLSVMRLNQSVRDVGLTNHW